MIDQSTVMLANSFSELQSMEAFRRIMDYLHKETAAAEGLAICAPAATPTEEVRHLIIAWQERRKVVLGIESLIEDQLAVKKVFEEEENNVRAVERDRSTRAEW